MEKKDKTNKTRTCSHSGSDEISDEESENLYTTNLKKKLKTGVVYLSFIPPCMTADILRRMLSQYAPVGRIFIQVLQELGEKKKRRSKDEIIYEGWVEFLKKRHAKGIADMLNNTKMGGKKKSKFYDCLWNIKYLPRFKWVHLMERLNYERAMLKQKLMAEISQARRVANHFKEAVDKQENIKRKIKSSVHPLVKDFLQEEDNNLMVRRFKQKELTEDIDGKSGREQKRENFLKNLFS